MIKVSLSVQEVIGNRVVDRRLAMSLLRRFPEEIESLKLVGLVDVAVYPFLGKPGHQERLSNFAVFRPLSIRIELYYGIVGRMCSKHHHREKGWRTRDLRPLFIKWGLIVLITEGQDGHCIYVLT